MSRLLVSNTLRALSARSYCSHIVDTHKIGTREIVGYGMNGMPIYADRVDFPLPAVRFRPDTPDIKQLREKEKGDWKALSLAEKKALYRASFCQTLAETDASNGEWKSVIGSSLVFMSLAVWVYMFFKLFAYNPTFPDSFKEPNQQAQLRRMIDLKINPITGLTSKWDYEKEEWKK
uniref:Cytochrome c oxidase subunit 4 n=1 Tax=Panstrongylus megistus TaxID=65343 RepID=A0A069DPY2_9HEMI